MNNNEPTATQRQHLAFQLLRQEALEAHREGDGLRINLLCKTAFDGIDSLLTADEFRLSLADVRWAFVFQFYWLVDNFAGHLASETFKRIRCTSRKDEDIAAFLKCQQYMISEPLSGVNPAFEMLNSLPLDILQESPESALEDTELLAHLAELAWFRSLGGNEWHPLLTSWAKHQVPWLAQLAKDLLQRLTWQSRLTASGPKRPIIDEGDIANLRVSSDLADLWLLHFHGQGDAVLRRVQELNPTLPNDSYRWRIVSDFWHIRRRQGSGLDTEEPQGRWLARRRSQTANSPLLQFHDRREMRFVEIAVDLLRENTSSNASDRFEIMQLAMLHELAALRLWDYGMWRAATKAQSLVWLESARWTNSAPEYVVSGLMLAVRASDLASPSKDELVRTSLRHLEFASESCLTDLVHELLATYPAQKYDALSLIDEISDLMPEKVWCDLANWTVVTSREMGEKRLRGQSTGPAAFWHTILPSLHSNSPIWSMLIDVAIEMANSETCWSGDSATFLSSWIANAPIWMARKVCDAMAGTKPAHAIFSLFRAELLIQAEDGRSELERQFTAKLPQAAPSQEERMILSERFKYNAEHEAKRGKEIFSNKFNGRLQLMLQNGSHRSPVPHERMGFDKIRFWAVDDKILLERTLGIINHPDVSKEHLPELLNAIQLFLARGPEEFFRIAQPYVKGWVQPSSSPQSQPDETHPFARFHNVRRGEKFIREELGWIVYQFVLRQDIASKELVDELATTAIQEQWLDATGIVSQCLFALLPDLMPVEIDMAFLRMQRLTDIVKAVLPWNEEAASELASVLSFISCFVGPHRHELVRSTAPQWPTITVKLTDIIRSLAPVAVRSTTAEVRIIIARVLVFFRSWHALPEELCTILASLAKDARARVRWEAARVIGDKFPSSQT